MNHQSKHASLKGLIQVFQKAFGVKIIKKDIIETTNHYVEEKP